MKRGFISAAVMLAVLSVACAPDDAAIPTTCTTVADCALDSVCDRATASCIPEPANRFLGAFECTIIDMKDFETQKIELSEIVGRIDKDRWSLPGTGCFLSTESDDEFMFQFLNVSVTGPLLELYTTGAKARTERVEIKPSFGDGRDDSARMELLEASVVYGTATGGHLEITGDVKVGSKIHGYLDISMIKAVGKDVNFGAPCAQGLAECGPTSGAGGGADHCSVVLESNPTPICWRPCKGDGDCTVGRGVCIDTFCTTSCKADADCTAPSKCVPADTPGQGKGCF
jgi:hypothetical protein